MWSAAVGRGWPSGFGRLRRDGGTGRVSGAAAGVVVSDKGKLADVSNSSYARTLDGANADNMSIRRPTGELINWNHVFYFSEIAAVGSIKSASERLGLSPSTLSEHLSQLESDLGVKLFQRHARKLLLTAEGARLFQQARQMFEMGRRFVDLISPIPLGSYPVTIGVVPGSTYAAAHRVVRRFVRACPGLSVNIRRAEHDDLELQLLESKADFGFTDRKSDRKDIVQHAIAVSTLSFFASAELGQKSLRELLAELPLLLCSTEHSRRSTVEEFLDSLDITPRALIVSEYPSMIEALCREGLGVAAVSPLQLEDDSRVRMLSLPEDFPVLTERLFASWVASANESAAVGKLRPLLAEFAVVES